MGFFDRWFGKKPQPRARAAALDTSEANLRAVLGTDNVTLAWGLAVEVTSSSDRAAHGGRDQVGGVPDNIGAESWPVCTMCRCPMAFVARIAVGPDEEPRYPERGSLALFLCNSEPADASDLCITADGPGSACLFVAETQRAATPMFSAAQLQDIGRVHDHNRENYPCRSYVWPRTGRWSARPVLEHAFRAERRRVVSCRPPSRVGPEAEEARELWAAASQASRVVIDIGGFADWIQAPIDDLVCTCGAPMELIIQYDSFDDAINLGDAGRAYVFACAKRCSATAFTARWQCC